MRQGWSLGGWDMGTVLISEDTFAILNLASNFSGRFDFYILLDRWSTWQFDAVLRARDLFTANNWVAVFFEVSPKWTSYNSGVPLYQCSSMEWPILPYEQDVNVQTDPAKRFRLIDYLCTILFLRDSSFNWWCCICWIHFSLILTNDFVSAGMNSSQTL